MKDEFTKQIILRFNHQSEKTFNKNVYHQMSTKMSIRRRGKKKETRAFVKTRQEQLEFHGLVDDTQVMLFAEDLFSWKF